MMKNELQDGVKEISSQDKRFPLYTYGVQENELQDGVKEILWQDEFTRLFPYVGNHDQHDHHDHSKSSIFFSEEGLKRGAKLDAQFPKIKYLTPLLPREIAEQFTILIRKDK
ncbi:hypothetical protein V8G54_008049 [Vigna mungo]|uniref:Uncharacterized protein n=1 Tax=Vigna mungo TaxID=3915 RepID=A0AAQ3P4W6_VIGMU